jgi:antitoxin component YwqK of YwqJK toxin-antitoxin module
MKYNEKGIIIQRIRYENSNPYRGYNLVVKNVETFSYNEKNQLIEQRIKKNYAIEVFKFKYDESGNLIENTTGSQDFIQIKKMHSYKNGKIQEIKNYELEKLKNSVVYKYDSDGNLVEELKVDDKNKIYSRIDRKYDNDGNLLSEASSEVNPSNIKATVCYYKKGKPDEIKVYDVSGKFFTWVKYQYDASSNLIEYIHLFENGGVHFKHVFKNNLIVEEFHNDEKGNLKYKIIYDYECWDSEG